MALTVWPVAVGFTISQLFGVGATANLPAWHPTILAYGNYQPFGHDGIDIACPMRTPIALAGRGKLDFAGDGRDMPDWVAIKYGFSTDPSAKWASGIISCFDHGDGTGTYYAHKDESWLDAQVGQWFDAGTIIGLSGNSGRSGGPHLHFSLVTFPLDYSDGMYSRKDPLAYYSTPYVIPTAPGNTGAPSIAEPEEIDMAAEKNIMDRLEQIVAWQDKRINDLASQAESNRNMLATFTRNLVVNQSDLTVEQIDAKLAELIKPAAAPQPLFKGDKDATVYAWGDKQFRALTFAEYLELISAGAVLQVLPQPVIDASVKGA